MFEERQKAIEAGDIERAMQIESALAEFEAQEGKPTDPLAVNEASARKQPTIQAVPEEERLRRRIAELTRPAKESSPLNVLLKQIETLLEGPTEKSFVVDGKVVTVEVKPDPAEKALALGHLTLLAAQVPAQAKAARTKELANMKARMRDLGTDPATGFRAAEGIGGVRIEKALGRRVRRSVDEAADFVDDVLGPISLKGPIPKGGSVEGLAKAAIKDAHFNTATDALFVDLRGLSAKAAAQVRSLVTKGTSGAAPRENSRIRSWVDIR